jgi:hypothetical protein
VYEVPRKFDELLTTGELPKLVNVLRSLIVFPLLVVLLLRKPSLLRGPLELPGRLVRLRVLVRDELLFLVEVELLELL